MNKLKLPNNINIKAKTSVYIDAVREINLYQNMVLVSGDSDFAYLVEVLQKEEKKVVVFSARGHISKELAQICDYYVNFEKLKDSLSL